MNFTEVKSSQVHSIGYDPETKTLAVRFHGKDGPGSLYEYSGIGPEKYADFMKAESKGKFLGKYIKAKDDKGNLLHPFKKIAEKERE